MAAYKNELEYKRTYGISKIKNTHKRKDFKEGPTALEQILNSQYADAFRWHQLSLQKALEGLGALYSGGIFATWIYFALSCYQK